MTRLVQEVTLSRSGGQPWGFRILGGRDEGLLCTVEKVNDSFLLLTLNKTFDESHKNVLVTSRGSLALCL